jgi:guanylate kinase
MIYCIVAQSSSGKSTVERRLYDMGFNRVISYTTRPPRNEQELDNSYPAYHFIDTTTFNAMEKEGKFEETATYRDWNYGLSLSDLDYKNDVCIAVVTVHGYEEIVKAVGKEHVIAIHIKVSERERVKRQLERGDELDEVIRRIATDRIDFARVEEISDYIVENIQLDKTLVEIYNIIRRTSAK